MRSEKELKSLQEKLKMFTTMMLVDRVKDEYSMVENIALTNFEHNEHTNKDYPEFMVDVDSNISVLAQTNIKQTIREHIESFFPEVFTILNANIKFRRSVKNGEIDERLINVYPKKSPPTSLGMF
jgi:uncharacterized protein YbcC (UPF0753/DUF2309 family)